MAAAGETTSEVVIHRDGGVATITLDRLMEWSQDIDEGAAAYREGRRPRFIGR